MEKLSYKLRQWCEAGGNCERWPQIDGVKSLCLDEIFKHIITGSCLLYSFGLADDWSFEEVTSNLGCKVTDNIL